ETAARPSLQLVEEQGQDAVGCFRAFARAVLVEHADLGTLAVALDEDAVLFLARRLGAASPEFETREPALFLGGFDVGVGIDIANEIKALRAVAVLERESDAVQCKADAAPGTVELVVGLEH